MSKEATASMSRTRMFSCAPGSSRGIGVQMKSSQRSTSAPGRASSWVLRGGVLVLVVGVAAFGTIYYQDQHVDAGPSMIDRQTTNAETAVKKAPNDIDARLTLAADYQEAKRFDEALTQYNIILTAAKGNRFALLGRGSVQTAKGNLTAATADYKSITNLNAKGEFAGADPQLQEAYYHLGSIAVTQGKTKEAIFELQAAIGIDPQDSDSLYLMGLAQLKAGAPKLAIDAFNKAVSFVPTGWCEPYTQLALAYEKLANAPEATYNAGMADFCHNKPAEAKRQLMTLIKGPQAVDAMLGLAVIADTDSNHAEAISWFKKVLVIDPKNVAATMALKQLSTAPPPSNTSPAPKAVGSSTTQGPS